MTRIVTQLPNTGFERPTPAEARALFEIVCAVHPSLRSKEAEQQFAIGLFAVGHMYRLPAPSKQHDPSWLLQQANENIIESVYWQPIEAPAFFLACRAHCDVPWQEHNGSLGALYELGLQPWTGKRLETPNAWRGLLDGTRNLLPPTPPRERFKVEPSPVRFWAS